MNSDSFDKKTVTAYWRTEAEEAFAVAQHLMETKFNLEARYPDLKRTFRVRCTRDYAQAQMARVEETLAWLRSRLM